MRVQLQISVAPNSKTIFAIPRSNEYQDIKDLSTLPELLKYKVIKDDRFANEIIMFEEQADIGFSFFPKERKMTIGKNFVISDYSPQEVRNIHHDAYMNGRDKKIIEISQKINGDGKKVGQIIENTYKYCLENLTYGKPIKGLYKYSQVLKDSTTDCGGFSTLMGSLLQAKDIPVRLVVGYVLKKGRKKALLNTLIKQKYSFNDFSMHAWLDAKLPNGTWFPLDASVEWRRIHGISIREGGFGLLPADRLVTSFGHNIELIWEGNHHIVEILQDPATIINS